MTKTNHLQDWLEHMGIEAEVHDTEDGVLIEILNRDYECNEERLKRWFVLKQVQSSAVMLMERQRGVGEI